MRLDLAIFVVHILSCLTTFAYGQSQGDCYHEGECLMSPFIDVTTQGTPAECSLHCDRYV